MTRALAILLLLTAPALAHDPVTGDSNWINEGRYRSPAGILCCGVKDCDQLDPKLVKATPAGLVLRQFGDELVPWPEVTPSEDGLYWRCHAGDGSRRCVFAPAGTN